MAVLNTAEWVLARSERTTARFFHWAAMRVSTAQLRRHPDFPMWVAEAKARQMTPGVS